jgi:hypothetical protein
VRGGRITISVVVAALLVCALVVAGCGGGSSSAPSSTEGTTASSTPAAAVEPHGEGGAEFRVPGGKKEEVNRIIDGSKEASAAEIEAASDVLAENLKARESHDWAAQCETLSKKMAKVVEQNGVVIASNQTCAENLGLVGAKASKKALADTMEGSLGALRLVGDGQAFAFFHGTEGKDYLIPMEREGSDWKVAALTAEPIPGS